MAEYLLFQLYGPMASWGDVAVGESRVTATHPGRSAMIGLLGAALGIRRDDDIAQQSLVRGYRIAVRVLSRGEYFRDYQTTQVAAQAALKGRHVLTRRDELAVDNDQLFTILSDRGYRCDAYYQVAVDTVGDGGNWSLAEMEAALKSPRYLLYLGRKSCPPALPLQPQCVGASNLVEAFAQARFDGPDVMTQGRVWHGAPSFDTQAGSLYWEDGMEAGIAVRETFTRRDQPRNRMRWQFDSRSEHHAAMSLKE